VSGEEHIVILLATILLILVNQVLSDNWCGTWSSSIYKTVNNFQTIIETAPNSTITVSGGDIVTDLPQIVHTEDSQLAVAQLKILEGYMLVSRDVPTGLAQATLQAVLDC